MIILVAACIYCHIKFVFAADTVSTGSSHCSSRSVSYNDTCCLFFARIIYRVLPEFLSNSLGTCGNMAASLPPLGGGIVFESNLPVADAPQINDSLDNILVIDNIPQVTQDKFDKLKAVILKVRK